MSIVAITALFSALLAFILGTALGFFRDFFAIEEDPLISLIREALPGANCGACGHPGCDGYASAIATGVAGISSCTVGGKKVAAKLSKITGQTANVTPAIAILACAGSKTHAPLKGEYTGIPTCRGAKLSVGGTKLCAWGCLGFGDCVAVCKYGALSMGENGLPHIDEEKCIGCKLCTLECPQALIQDIPKTLTGPQVLCTNRNTRGALVTRACKAGCIKCELCVKNCPEECMTMVNGIPVINYAACTSCGTCIEKCPTKVIIQRQSA